MPRLPEAMVDNFEALVADGETDMVEYLWPHVNPDMAAMERARKAVLLTLASHSDRGSSRGRCHTLLVGPPGTGKTFVRDWVKVNITEAYGIGQKSSEAGLKGDFSKDPHEPGALQIAHGGVLCVEELDKFAKSERDALYESMSEGAFEVNVGDTRETFAAEIRTIATANSTEPFKNALIDRFDFVLELDEYDADETDEVTETLYDNWWSAFIEGDVATEGPLLPHYLKWIETFEPGGNEEARRRIHKMRQFLIHDGGFTGEIRQKEAYLRIAYTVAKLNRRDMTPYDYLRAVELLHPEQSNGSLRYALKALADGEEIESVGV